MSVSLAAGKRLTTDDIIQLARSKPNQISVDEAILRKADADYPVKDTSLFEISEESGADMQLYSTDVVRVSLIYRIFSLLMLKSPVRSSTIKALENLVNYQVTPYFTSCESAGKELIAFLAGKGYASTVDNAKVPASEALAAHGLQQHVVTVRESALFLNHPFLAIATALVVGYGANNLLKAVDPIVALSCEAAGVKADIFDSTLFEVYRQHRGQMLSAGNLKLLLEGSKRTGTNKNVSRQYTEFLSSPQITGPCQEAIAITNK